MIGRTARDDAGFSLVEALVAAALLIAATGILFRMATDGQQVARAQPEKADMQQRLRVAADMIQRDLLAAGAGLIHGESAGPLTDFLPPIVPARTGARNPDPELSFHDDRISILFVPDGATGSPLLGDMPSPGADVVLNTAGPGCPAAGLCGFVIGTRALIFDRAGLGAGFDTFTVTGTAGALAHAAQNPPFSRAYPGATSLVAPVRQRVYYLDRVNWRLMLYDGYQTDVPLADHVVDLRFAYFSDSRPDGVPRPPAGQANCVFDAGVPPVPRLLGYGGASLHPVGAAELTDGPVCGLAPNRFDGDLLRIRRVRVTIRVEAGDAAMRGTGPAFVRSGHSSHGNTYLPDYEVTFEVAPRNMFVTR